MLRIDEIASYIIYLCNRKGHPIQNSELQLYLYYIEAEYMRLNNGKPLFKDDAYAWAYGPTYPNVYSKYKKFGMSDLVNDYHKYDFRFKHRYHLKIREVKDIIKVIESNIDETYGLDRFDKFIELLNRYDGLNLIYLSRSQTPWLDAYEDYGHEHIITKDAMRNYFCKKPDIMKSKKRKRK